MHASSSGPWMIVGFDDACVCGDIEVSPAPSSPSREPDPGDTVRMPAFDYPVSLRPRPR